MSYQRYCEEFALYSSPLEEHLEHEAGAQFDDDRERWAAEAESMRYEGMWAELEFALDDAEAEKIMRRWGYTRNSAPVRTRGDQP
jgi:hypothetical protein